MRDLIRGTVRDHRLVSSIHPFSNIARRLQVPLQLADPQSRLPEGLQALPRIAPHQQAECDNVDVRSLRKSCASLIMLGIRVPLFHRLLSVELLPLRACRRNSAAAELALPQGQLRTPDGCKRKPRQLLQLGAGLLDERPPLRDRRGTQAALGGPQGSRGGPV